MTKRRPASASMSLPGKGSSLAYKLNSKFKIASLAEIQEDMKADF